MSRIPPEVWESRPELRVVRATAWDCMTSPDAVLLAVLTRLAAFMPPSVVVQSWSHPTALNLLVCIVGTSGQGKGSVCDAARHLVPSTTFESIWNDLLDGDPVSTGEGLIEGYLSTVTDPEYDGKGRPRLIKKQTKTRWLAEIDEGQTLVSQTERRGSTLAETLTSMWSGRSVGQTGATVETRRKLEAGSYSFGLLIGWQPELMDFVFGREQLGLPQRLLFATATDPDIPAPTPGARRRLTTGLEWRNAQHFADLTLLLPPKATEHMAERAWERATGQVQIDRLDMHRDLLVTKVSALLAILADRDQITEEDCQIAKHAVHASFEARDDVKGILDMERARERAAKQRTEGGLEEARLAAGDTYMQRRDAAIDWLLNLMRDTVVDSTGKRVHATDVPVRLTGPKGAYRTSRWSRTLVEAAVAAGEARKLWRVETRQGGALWLAPIEE